MGLDLDKAAPNGDGAPGETELSVLAFEILCALRKANPRAFVLGEPVNETSINNDDVLIDGNFNLLLAARFLWEALKKRPPPSA